MTSPAKFHGLTGPERATGDGHRRSGRVPNRILATVDAAPPEPVDPPTLSDRALAVAIAYHDAMRRAWRSGLATEQDLRYARTRLRRIGDRIDLRSGTITAAEARAGWGEDAAAGVILED